MVYSTTAPVGDFSGKGGVAWYFAASLPGNTTAFDGQDALLPSPGTSFTPGTITLIFPPTAPAKPQTVIFLS